MISSQKNNILGEVLLDGEQQSAHFDAIDAPIDIVAKEQVVQIARLTCLADHVEQVSILAMDVTNYTDWLVNLD